MSRQQQLTPWAEELNRRLPDLPCCVVFVLALYSFGVVLAGACGLTTVVLCLCHQLGYARHALRKRLREFYLDAGDKSGQKRQQLDVACAFAPLLRWVLSLWEGRHLPLAIDVTNLGDCFHVLCVSVAVRGCAIPVAWKVLPGNQKEPWGPHWKALLGALKPAVPDGWVVIVLSDRGLESPALFGDIVELGWHPIMRVKKGGKFRPTGWRKFYAMHELAGRVGASLSAEGLAYAATRMPCTLLARWEEGYEEPWLLLTDLPPEAGQAVWYGLRCWIEQGFKVIKGGGWCWHRTRMEDAERAERLWLVLAVASLWAVALGCDEEEQERQRAERRELQRALEESAQQAEQRRERERRRKRRQEEALARRRERLRRRQESKAQKKQKQKGARKPKQGATSKRRTHRVSKLGREVLNGARRRGECPLPRALHPEPWPHDPHPVMPLNELDFFQPRQNVPL